jgi:enoyl-[acyl-carrier-protein] reductase (NADH)
VFDHFVDQTPLKLEQTAEDIGRTVAFLASEDARTITGQALLVDSGAVMQ